MPPWKWKLVFILCQSCFGSTFLSMSTEDCCHIDINNFNCSIRRCTIPHTLTSSKWSSWMTSKARSSILNALHDLKSLSVTVPEYVLAVTVGDRSHFHVHNIILCHLWSIYLVSDSQMSSFLFLFLSSSRTRLLVNLSCYHWSTTQWKRFVRYGRASSTYLVKVL
jgi:hypothetical protein